MLDRGRDRFTAFKKKLFAEEPAFGLVVQSVMTSSAELVALAGYDFAWLDMEHTAMSLRDVEHAIIALENYDCVPLVRVRDNEANGIGQVLDLGARIVMVPHVDTAEDALRAVRGAKYHPLGRRGYSTCSRSTGQGMERLDLAAMTRKNADTLLMVQIESQEAVRNAASIAAVEGVDILFVGCADLCQDMGLAPDPSHPRMQDAIGMVSQAIKATGKAGGLIVSDPAQAAAYRALGFNLICCGLDTMIFKNAIVSLLARFKDEARG